MFVKGKAMRLRNAIYDFFFSPRFANPLRHRPGQPWYFPSDEPKPMPPPCPAPPPPAPVVYRKPYVPPPPEDPLQKLIRETNAMKDGMGQLPLPDDKLQELEKAVERRLFRKMMEKLND